MSRTIACPHCSNAINNDPQLAGRIVVCPRCRGQLQMPGLSAPLPPPIVAPQVVINTGSRPRASNRIDPKVWIGIAVLVPVLLIFSCCGGLLVLNGLGGGGGGQMAGKSLDEIERELVGKTSDVVISQIGRPAGVRRVRSGQYWYYYNVTTDPVSNETLHMTLTLDINGEVTKVSWQ